MLYRRPIYCCLAMVCLQMLTGCSSAIKVTLPPIKAVFEKDPDGAIKDNAAELEARRKLVDQQNAARK